MEEKKQAKYVEKCTCDLEGKESKGDLPVKNEVFSRNLKSNEKNNVEVEIPCIKGKPRTHLHCYVVKE